MRTIQKTISLEPMTSRLPGVLPAYKDNVLYYFDEESLKAREYEFTSNYGMIPVNIMLSQAPSAVTDWKTVELRYDSHCYGETLGTDRECYEKPFYDEFGRFTLSWEELSDWYKFFTDYYHLLNDWGHCGVTYSSATQYYMSESKNGYAPQLVYGADKETYTELDERFTAMGGIVSASTCSATSTSEVEGNLEYKCNFDNCSAHTVITDSYDVGFYKWICDNLIPSYKIPLKYKDYWRRDKLYFPDVIKWIGWIEDRSGYGESGYTIFNCSASTDCCECEDWFRRGGNDILSSMTEWYGTVSGAIKTNNEIVSGSVGCAIPTIVSPLTMQVSIDNLGEFSIFSKEYELGIDYRTVPTESGATATRIHYESGNTDSGTVVTMDGEAMILTSGAGFSYDATYMEAYVTSCKTCCYEGQFTDHCPRCGSKDIVQIGWEKYDPDSESGHVACSFDEYDYAFKEDLSGYSIDSGSPIGYSEGEIFYYTFDDDDRRVTSTEEDKLRSQLAVRYPIQKRDAILIGSSLYDIQKKEYGIYDEHAKYIGGKKFYVYRDEYTDTPYTLINGKRVYADFYPFGDSCNQYYYFTFFKEEDKTSGGTCSASTFNPNIYKKFPRTSTTIKEEDCSEFITYAGTQHEVTSNSAITINGNEYIRITSGVCETPDGVLFITDTNRILHYDAGDVLEYEPSEEKYEVIPETFEIQKKVDEDIDVYVSGLLSGRTVSKLYDLRSTSLLSDDIGNTIQAVYKIEGECYNHQPPEGSKLEPIYQVGNVANVNRFSMTVEKQEDLMSGETNYFIGDIITGMKFYYRDNEGNTIIYHEGEDDEISTVVEASTDKTSLEAIEEVQQKREEIEEAIRQASGSTFIFDDDIYCDITYYIGATLQRTEENKPFKIAENTSAMTFSSGICYTETVKFVETEVQYYLKTEIKKQIPTTENTVSAHTLSYPVTCYILEQEMTEIESDYDNYYKAALAHFEMPMRTDTTDFERYNGTKIFPVFREEYKMGTACIQNVDVDIYIDRGINAAFEKHLKLGEITSMEALEQYTNGYFKIMNN